MLKNCEYHIRVYGEGDKEGVIIVLAPFVDEAIEIAFDEFEEKFPDCEILDYDVVGKIEL